MPEISVVIPTYQRAALAERCVRALLNEGGPDSSFEVIVVVDGSTDDTQGRLETLGDQRVRVVTQPRSGAASARNRGAREATGEYVLFLDDDLTPAPGLPAAHEAAQRSAGGVVGLGRLTYSTAERAGAFVRASSAWWNDHYGGLAAGRPPSAIDCYAGNLSVPRAAFLDVGGFATDLPFRHDVELGYRLEQAGLRFAFVPAAVAHQDHHEERTAAVLRDARDSAEASLELYRRHPPLLPRLELGSFVEGPRGALLRRVLVALRVPVRPAAWATRLLAAERRGPWARFVWRLAYWRHVRRKVDRDRWQRLTRGVSVLLYHAFCAPGEPARRYCIPSRRLERQLGWLRRRYPVISVEELVEHRARHTLPPARSVVITIDDGFVETLDVAAPAFERRDLGATMYVVSGRVGGTADWSRRPELHRRPLLSWDGLREARAGPFEVGAHTRSHRRLPELPPDELTDEVAGSRVDLEERIGGPIRSFAYPYGSTSPTVEQAAADAGYAAAFRVEPGVNGPSTPSHGLRRIEIRGTDSFLRFVLTLWLGGVPDLYRRGRRRS
jgi:glycosyltransferase involved in cell wall biosynthesis/peptidoglycan/xylan/chitin deacetylase (PgdA/CDA1 family)